MNRNQQSEQRLLRELSDQIRNELSRVGVLFHVFERVKSSQSLEAKLEAKAERYAQGAKIQDVFGVRIALYFADDVTIAQRAVQQEYEILEDSSQIDHLDPDTFRPMRYNLVVRIPERQVQFCSIFQDPRIDSTFEVQLRTVLSEGWHEVDHDLRYKCLADWDTHDDLQRSLNGVLATLETCDWSMLSLFDELALRHYRNCSWTAMLRTKFRLRLGGERLSERICTVLADNSELAKAVYRANRKRLLADMLSHGNDMPLTYDSLVFLINRFYVNSESLRRLEPEFWSQQFEA